MDNQREFFVKWMKYLFVIQAVTGVELVLSVIPALNAIAPWVNRGQLIATMVVLFHLMPLNERYKKALILRGVGVVLALFTSVPVLVIAAVICSMIYSYQEYHGHAEMIEVMDEKLAKNWHRLFYWEIFSGLIAGLASGVIIAVGVVAFPVSTETLTSITLVISEGVSLLLCLVYMRFLKRTYTVYGKCEKIEMNDSYE